MADKQKGPDTLSGAAKRMQSLAAVCRDVDGGTPAMREAGVRYLPVHPAEEAADYARRLTRATLFNALGRTLDALVGMLLRKDVVLAEPDPILEEHAVDIDRTGRDITQFTRDVCRATLAEGMCLILVDYPMVEGLRTLAQERMAGVRPHWVIIRAQDFVSARFRVEGGAPIVEQLVWREDTTEEDGPFGEVEVELYRVLRVTTEGQGEWELWRKGKEKGDDVIKIDDGTWSMPGAERTVIPVVPVYGDRVAHFEGHPPLLDLAWENVSHWQVRADHYHAMHVVNVPIPIFVGRDRDDEDEEVKVGPSYGLDLPEGGEAKYMEAQGHGLTHSREELKDIEARMAALGLSMLVRETRAAETAQAKAIDKAAEDSALAAFAAHVETALNACLALHARWSGTDSPGQATINRDFLAQTLDAGLVDTLSKMVEKRQLSLDSMWRMLVEGELLPENFDPDLEKELIEATEAQGLAAAMAAFGQPTPPEGDDDADEDEEEA